MQRRLQLLLLLLLLSLLLLLLLLLLRLVYHHDLRRQRSNGCRGSRSRLGLQVPLACFDGLPSCYRSCHTSNDRC
jgi:hypothetical protein